MNRRELLRYTAVAMGMGAASSMLQGALAACDGCDSPGSSVLGAQGRPTVAALAELIIPETDTPGATSAGVPEFIDQIVSHWYTETEQKIFLDGLIALDDSCQSAYGRAFVDCIPSQQTAVLSKFEALAMSYEPQPGICSIVRIPKTPRFSAKSSNSRSMAITPRRSGFVTIP